METEQETATIEETPPTTVSTPSTPRRSRRTARETENIASDTLRPESEEPTPEETQMNSILAELGRGGGKIRVERRGPGEATYALACTLTADEFDVERISILYGGGDYRCRTFRANGSFFKPFEFAIAPFVKGTLTTPEVVQPSNSGAEIVAALAPLLDKMGDKGPVDHMPMIMQMMESSKSDMQALMSSQATQQQSSQQMMMTMMMTMMTEAGKSNSAMVTAIAARPETPTPTSSMAEMMPLFLKMMEMKAGGGEGDFNKTLEAVERIQELTNGGKEDEGTLGKIGKIAAGLFGGLMPAAAGGVLPPPAPQIDQPRTEPPYPTEEPAPATDMNLLQKMQQKIEEAAMARYLEQVLSAAERDEDPVMIANSIAMSLGDNSEKLISVLTEPAWCATLFGEDPRSVNHREWLEDLRIEFLALYQPDEHDETTIIQPGDSEHADSSGGSTSSTITPAQPPVSSDTGDSGRPADSPEAIEPTE